MDLETGRFSARTIPKPQPRQRRINAHDDMDACLTVVEVVPSAPPGMFTDSLMIAIWARRPALLSLL